MPDIGFQLGSTPFARSVGFASGAVRKRISAFAAATSEARLMCPRVQLYECLSQLYFLRSVEAAHRPRLYTSYTASVGDATGSVTVTPTVADSTATVTVDGVKMREITQRALNAETAFAAASNPNQFRNSGTSIADTSQLRVTLPPFGLVTIDGDLSRD